ncbi:MAG TPA: HAD-IIA family hydrolase [Streptosporangiaceae bacterium]|nr:HAD-IIA family hydrolase [Streptosporangiaceae bacterium]
MGPDRLYAGYALDLDGTVYLGDSLLPRAAETIGQIRRAGAQLVFLTNNPLHSQADYAARLTALGVPASPAEIVTPLAVLTRYLHSHHAATTVLTVAEPLVDATLAAAGITVTSEPAAAGVVVVSFDRTFSYHKLLAAYRAVRHHGAVIVATNPDPFCPTPDGGLPDCAAMLAAIEACTNAKAEAIVGKPSQHMAAELLRMLAVDAADAVIVGDRITTDVAMSVPLGMSSVLVLSGATSAAEVRRSAAQPDFIISGLADLLPADARRRLPEGSPW